MLHLVLAVDPNLRSRIRKIEVQKERPLQRLHQEVDNIGVRPGSAKIRQRISVCIVDVTYPLMEAREMIRYRLFESIRDA